MKRIITWFAFSFILGNAMAQKKDTVTVTSVLNHATVYYGYGAELQHSANAVLRSGVQELVISDMALQPDLNSIQIACPANTTILSYLFRVVNKTKTPKDTMDTNTSLLKALEKRLAQVNNDYNINDDVLNKINNLIQNKFGADDKKPMSSLELIKLTEYYAAKIETLKNKLFNLDITRKDIIEKINELSNKEVSEDMVITPHKQIGQLVLQVMSTKPAQGEFKITYFTPNAGWIPSYEIKVASLENTLRLGYKAAVTQTTGLDWKQVDLTLSTSNPGQGSIAPVITPEFLQLYVPQLYNVMQRSAAMDEVVVTAMGLKRENKEQGYSSVKDYVLVKESQLNTSYEISLPYTIPATGKPYTVSIKEEKVQASFKDFAVPKLDRDAFLVADVTRWDSLNLLPGDANIIMDNVYIGKSFIDPNSTDDTLSIPMGRDKRISINRVLVKDYTSKQFLGSNKSEVFTYDITIKNNKKQAVSLTLKDQIPVSKLKEIEVTTGTVSGAVKDDETGILTWLIKLQPGESKKVRFSYTMKYPKDKKVQHVKE